MPTLTVPAPGGISATRRLADRPTTDGACADQADANRPTLTHRGRPHADHAHAGRAPADRAYYFIDAPDGALEWVYYDRLVRRWYRQGWVE